MKINLRAPSNKNFSYPENPDFGSVHTPLTLHCDISKEHPVPEEVQIETKDQINLDIFCSALHYGQSIFEGLKAYRTANDKVAIYRAKEHVKRMVRSSEIMCMVPLQYDFVYECLTSYVEAMAEYVPSEPGHALYLRPLYFANDPLMKVRNSDSYKFLIMSSIVGDYFATLGDKKIKVLVAPQYVRAFPGGTGEAKTAANYAQSLPSLNYAHSKGYQQVIYLDAEERKYIDELGGMNFFWVENGKICTPTLTGQILQGVTRLSLLEVAPALGFEVEEKRLSLQELQDKSKNGEISEVFACGTAAILSPLHEIGVLEKTDQITPLRFSEFPVMEKLKNYLVKTQRGLTDHSEKFLTYIN